MALCKASLRLGWIGCNHVCVHLDLYIGILTMLCFFFNPSQCIKQNLPLSCFVFLTMLYPTHIFNFGIIFSMCAIIEVGDKY